MATYARYAGGALGGGSGGMTDSFVLIQTPFGTSPVATTPTSVLTLASGDGTVVITGNSGTDTVDFSVPGATGGTVKSVALADGSNTPIYTISGSPVTSTGTLTFTLNTELANTVFAGPVSGGATQPTFRSLVAGDIPALSYVTSVALALPVSVFTISGSPVTSSGTLTGSFNTQAVNTFFAGPSTGPSAVPTFRAITAADLPAGTGTVTSVAFADGSTTPIYTITGSPVTTSGTLTETLRTQTANTVFAGPTSGGAAQPAFRALVAADIPFPISGFTPGSVIFAGASGSLSQDNSKFFWDDTNFRLGIGLNTPATVLDIVNNSGGNSPVQTTGYGGTVGFRGRYANGSLGSPTAAVATNVLNFIAGRGWFDGTGFATASTGSVNIVAGETFTSTSMATYLQFQVTPTGSATISEKMRLNSTGNLLLGTTTDAAGLLQVGTSSQFQVDTSGNIKKINNVATSFPASQGSAGTVYTNNDGAGNILWGPGLWPLYFGMGSDGNVTISSGNTTLARDMFYNNLTINSTGSLSTNSYRVFVLNTLDISGTQVSGISCNAGSGGAGNGNGTAGTAGSGGGSNSLGGGNQGGIGGVGTTTAGAGGGPGAAGNNGGNVSHISGAGGAGVSAGGVGQTPAAISLILQPGSFKTDIIRGVVLLLGGTGGAGGGSGGGDGTNNGGGGGGGGGGAKVMWISANIIARGTNTNAGIFAAQGGVGGNGGSPPTSTLGAGGGGGGSGGGAGVMYIFYGSLTGSTITNALIAKGGNGGNGGNGLGTAGVGGKGGASGDGGNIILFNLSTNTLTASSAPTTGNAGGANSGATGGTGDTSPGIGEISL